MRVDRYSDLKLIASTNAAEIYDACYEGKENRIYILKKYTQSDISETAIQNEMDITQMIEQYATRSIVVPIYGKVNDDCGSTYLVMEKKQAGVFLAELMEGRRISLAYALRCTEEVLKSLVTLHAFAGSQEKIGFLHLDLHPGNIFLENADVANETAGNAKFIDFATAVKMINGVPGNRTIAAVSPFSAPELYSRSMTSCTVTADLYSVAAIFYALFVGGNLPGVGISNGSTKVYEKPSAAPNAETAGKAGLEIAKCCRDRHIPDSVTRAVCAVMQCALDDNPVYRYRNAQKMLDAVQRINRLLEASAKNEYETIFRMEYEDFTDIHDVHPETLTFDQRAFGEAAMSLDRMLHADRIDAAFAKYLFDLYWKMVQPHIEELSGDVLCKFINSGIAACNHTGDVVLGPLLAAMLHEMKGKINVSDYLEINNRLAVPVADAYEFAEAAAMQEKNVQALRKIRDGYIAAGNDFGMDTEDNVRSIPLARALSSLAVYRAIAYPETPKEEIYALYDEAIREFGGGYNIKITRSRRMHYELMIKDRKSFEKTCASYINVELKDQYLPLGKWIEQCIRNEKGRDWYGLYALVKSIYVFYMPQLRGACVSTAEKEQSDSTEILREIDDCNHIIEMLHEIGDHMIPRNKAYDPIQAIFRYFGLIEYELTGEVNDRVEDYFCAALKCQKEAEIDINKPLNIYMLIAYQTCAIYLGLTGKKKKSEELGKMLTKHARKSGCNALVAALESGRPVAEILVHEYA